MNIVVIKFYQEHLRQIFSCLDYKLRYSRVNLLNSDQFFLKSKNIKNNISIIKVYI
jgi:hypothetical protein